MGILVKAIKLRKLIEEAAQFLPEEQGLEGIELYPEWKNNQNYEIGRRVRYNDILYEVITSHIAQVTWTPDVSVSLFKKVLIVDESIIDEWQQPDSTNGYSIGSKVRHKGYVWVSQVDNNIWEPGVVGTEALWIKEN